MNKASRFACGSLFVLNVIVLVLTYENGSPSVIFGACLFWISLIQVVVISSKKLDEASLSQFTLMHIVGCFITVPLILLAYHAAVMVSGKLF